MATTTTFDINKIDKEALDNPASWKQVQGISYRFGKAGFAQSGKTDYRRQSQIRGCLWGLAKKGKLSFQKGHVLMNAKTFPKVYQEAIKEYLLANPEAEIK